MRFHDLGNGLFLALQVARSVIEAAEVVDWLRANIPDDGWRTDHWSIIVDEEPFITAFKLRWC